MGMKRRQDYASHSRKVIRSARWRVLRQMAKRRDGWKCVKCGAVGRLEVDHIRPVRDAPELAFDLSNLQTLCARCHSAKTRLEVALSKGDHSTRAAWRDLVAAMAQPQQKEKLSCWNQ